MTTPHKLKRSIMLYVGGPANYSAIEKVARGKFDLIIFDTLESARNVLSECPDVLIQIIVIERPTDGYLQRRVAKEGAVGANPFADGVL